MKLKHVVINALLFTAIYTPAKSQILISLLLGDKLNTGKIEFGLEGGLNYVGFHNLDEGSHIPNLNLGFYFYFKESDHSYIQTGVLVKENQGARDLNVYYIGDPAIDSLFVDGRVDRKIGYFQVPFTYHYRISSGIFLEGGFQLALRNKARDYFTKNVIKDDDLNFIYDTNDNYKRLDAGLIAGLGYKFRKRENGHPGISIGGKYYYGLVNVSGVDSEELMNDSFYIYVRIPVGGGVKPAN